eukprot:Gb_32502 [translate_table: standard]
MALSLRSSELLHQGSPITIPPGYLEPQGHFNNVDKQVSHGDQPRRRVIALGLDGGSLISQEEGNSLSQKAQWGDILDEDWLGVQEGSQPLIITEEPQPMTFTPEQGVVSSSPRSSPDATLVRLASKVGDPLGSSSQEGIIVISQVSFS